MKTTFLQLLVLCGYLVLILWAGSGCATSTAQKLNQLDLGMSQAQVKKILGDNYIAKASKTDAAGAHLQLWEYTDKKTQEAYRVYFKTANSRSGARRANWISPS